MEQETGPTILLVDDDPEHNQALAKILRRAGYRVQTTAEGQEALGILRQRSVDLIITDLSMPGISGLDLLGAIKAMNADTPVIVLTAYGEWTSYTEAMDIGAANYLTKPARSEDILGAIRMVLVRRGVRPPGNPTQRWQDEPRGTAA